MYVDFCLIVLAVFLTSPMKENVKKVVVSFVNVAVVVIISERKKNHLSFGMFVTHFIGFATIRLA